MYTSLLSLLFSQFSGFLLELCHTDCQYFGSFFLRKGLPKGFDSRDPFLHGYEHVLLAIILLLIHKEKVVGYQ